MRRRLWIALLALTALAVCVPVLLVPQPPQGAGGSVDLSAWSFERSGPVALTSGWEFRPSGRSPSDAAGSFLPARKGVYEIVLRTPPNDRILSVYLNNASDFRIRANGRPLTTSGPRFPLPETLSFRPKGGRTVLTIQSFGPGSFSRPPVLAIPGQIERLALLTLLWEAVVVGGLLLLGIYQLAVFLGSREDRAPLYLSLVCAAAALHTGLGGSALPAVFWPTLHSAWRVRLQAVGGYGAMLAGLYFLEVAFPEEISRAFRNAGSAVLAGVAVVSAAFLPTQVALLQPLFYVVLAAYFGLTILITLQRVRRRAEGSSLLLLGVAALSATALHDALSFSRGLLPLWLAPGGLAVLVGTQALWLSQRTALRMRREAALSRENERLLSRADRQLKELRTSRALLLEMEEGVRREIAEMLHSRIQSRLLLIWHRLGDLEHQLEEMALREAKEVLASIRADLDAVRERDIRAASHRLHPSVIELGLLPAVRSVADGYADRFPVRVRADRGVMALDRSVEDRLPLALRMCVYRAVEVALQNADRHGRASRVAIHLRIVDARLRLRVRDDGVGLDSGQLRPGLGLRSVAARISVHDGSWRLLGTPGRGATLEIELPLPQTAAGGGQHGNTARHPR